MELTIKRGDIYYAELNPVIGSEQDGTRPVLIISNDIGNKHMKWSYTVAKASKKAVASEWNISEASLPMSVSRAFSSG